MNALLYTENLSKFFEGRKKKTFILDNTNLKFHAGKSYAITGESGSGKSTLLHILSGMEKPSSGRVFFDNREISRFDEQQMATLRNKSIGFVFQQHSLIQELSVIENVMLPALVFNAEQRKMVRMRAEWVLQHIGLLRHAAKMVGELSGGEMQRVSLARALMNGPKLLFADEPTGNLDAFNAERIATVLTHYAKNCNAIVLIATHDSELAAQTDFAFQIEKRKLEPTIY